MNGPSLFRLFVLHRLSLLSALKAAKVHERGFYTLLLIEDAPRSTGDIARDIGVTAPQMTRVSTALRRKSLVTLELDAEDRRVINLTLTDRGREALVTIRKELVELLHRQTKVPA